MKILNPPCISLDFQKSRASKISCVYIDTDTEIPYEELGYVMMEAEKFPDVPPQAGGTRRAVAHLSQKAQGAKQSHVGIPVWKLAVSRPKRSWCFSPGPKARKEQGSWLSLSGRRSLSQPLFALFIPAGADNLLLLSSRIQMLISSRNPYRQHPEWCWPRVTDWHSVTQSCWLWINHEFTLANLHP